MNTKLFNPKKNIRKNTTKDRYQDQLNNISYPNIKKSLPNQSIAKDSINANSIKEQSIHQENQISYDLELSNDTESPKFLIRMIIATIIASLSGFLMWLWLSYYK